jgi:hypothetical protein
MNGVIRRFQKTRPTEGVATRRRDRVVKKEITYLTIEFILYLRGDFRMRRRRDIVGVYGDGIGGLGNDVEDLLQNVVGRYLSGVKTAGTIDEGAAELVTRYRPSDGRIDVILARGH